MTVTEQRPWGRYTTLHITPRYKVKEIVVFHGMRLSYQSHEYRDEHWLCIGGEGIITLDDRKFDFKPGTNFDIRRGQKHRIECTSPSTLVFVEIQTGESFAEDDIIRYEDDYGRVDE